MNRRLFLTAIAAGAVVTAEGLWVPGAKLISIPRPARFGRIDTVRFIESDMDGRLRSGMRYMFEGAPRIM